MGILGRLRSLFADRSPEQEAMAKAHEEELRQKIVARCTQFRKLLARNKTALELMSDIEVHLQQKKNVAPDYVQSAGTKVCAAVGEMVACLMALSGGAYGALESSLSSIREKIEETTKEGLSEEETVRQITAYVIPLSDIRLEHMQDVGGKMANLGEIRATVGLAVPNGFAITAAAYDYFMSYSKLDVFIREKVLAADRTSLDEAVRLSQLIQNAILAAPLPPDLERAIEDATEALVREEGPDVLLALRSSALGEDSKNMSFAGQYRSELNVPPEEACHVWKEIIASTFSLSAMTYRLQKGLSEERTSMCVGVLAMVKAVCGGVAYSRNPVSSHSRKDCVVINAVPGLPQGVVDGASIPDVFYLRHSHPPVILDRKTVSGGVTGILGDDFVIRLAHIAMALEGFYEEPQDVEWALNDEQELVILQSRPLGLAEDTEDTLDPEMEKILANAQVLASGGIQASPGVGIGVPCVLKKEADMFSFPGGGIMVVERAFPRWAALLPRARGLISETGGAAGHLASVAREYRIPALFSLKNACTLLADAGEITLDVGRSTVFAGRLEALVPKQKEETGEVTESLRLLERVSSFITPLHLLDPESPDFAPEKCTSLHDITRFCHEKAVNLLFDMQDTQGKQIGKQLKAGAKLQYWIVDMGRAFTKPVTGSVVDIREIASLPMLALWDGMTAIPWLGPPSAGAAGFMSVVLESTMNPELESTAPTTMTERNFFILDADYMILQARYGYHFCTVECRVCEKRSENFVTFQFKGGAADRDRRILRVRMLAGLLEEFQFRVDVREDALSAVAEGFSFENTLRRACLLGYLLIHSRQSDTIMLDTPRATAFRAKLAQDMQTVFQRDLAFVKK